MFSSVWACGWCLTLNQRRVLQEALEWNNRGTRQSRWFRRVLESSRADELLLTPALPKPSLLGYWRTEEKA